MRSDNLQVRKGRFLLVILAVLFVVFVSDRAVATQIHSEPEGLYAHQLAHLFFVFSMGILVYWLRQMELIRHRGWRYIRHASLLFMLWNLDAMLVHHLDGTEGFATVQGIEGWEGAIRIESASPLLALVYYVAKLDHLLCVPAIVFWFLGLRALLADLKSVEKGGDAS